MVAVCNYGNYFVQKKDDAHDLGLFMKQKNDGCLMLAYRATAYVVDEIKRMEKSIVLDYLDKFSTIYYRVFSPTYHN